MMATLTLSSKNQITIPKAILDFFGIKSGEKLLVDTQADTIRIKPMGKSIVDELVGSIHVDKSKMGIPYEKVLEITKKRIARKIALQ